MSEQASVYDYVYPLGQWCATALCLEKLGLRSCSGPFDWLLGSKNDVARYVAFIIMRFEGFLLRENLRRVGEDRHAGHDYYEDVGSGFEFRHDFALGEDLAASFPGVRTKYDRRIARLLDVLLGGHRVLFVHYRGEGLSDLTDLTSAVERLRQHFPLSEIDLLALETDTTCKEPRFDHPAQGVTRVVSDFYDKSRFDTVLGNERLVCKVLRTIRLKGRWRNLLHLRIKSIRSRLRRGSKRCA